MRGSPCTVGSDIYSALQKWLNQRWGNNSCSSTGSVSVQFSPSWQTTGRTPDWTCQSLFSPRNVPSHWLPRLTNAVLLMLCIWFHFLLWRDYDLIPWIISAARLHCLSVSATERSAGRISRHSPTQMYWKETRGEERREEGCTEGDRVSVDQTQLSHTLLCNYWHPVLSGQEIHITTATTITSTTTMTTTHYCYYYYYYYYYFTNIRISTYNLINIFSCFTG